MTKPLFKNKGLPDCVRAMPSARATRAPHRANLCCLGLSVGIAIALAGCDQQPRSSEIVMLGQVSKDIWVVRDVRTGCEYLWTTGGGLTLRHDPRGHVTPNCSARVINE